MSEHRFFVPEVVQTSEMDCGPASLKALLEGFGINVSYGRLREACQTAVDGTSIDTIEAIAVQLGLAAEQIMIPPDHLLVPEAQAMPALVVVALPNGMTHFVVAWSVHASFIQLMDPARGRRWTPWTRFVNELFIHRMPVPASAWREFAGTDNFLGPLRHRMHDLEIADRSISGLIDGSLADPLWRSIAALDASVRLVTSIMRSRGLEAGTEAEQVVTAFYERGGQDVPMPYWFVRQSPEKSKEETLVMRGAVLVRVLGKRAERAADEGGDARATQKLPPELAAALSEAPVRPELEIWNAIKEDGWLAPTLIITALLLASVGVIAQALLLQTIMRSGAALLSLDQHAFIIIALLVFVAGLFALELPLSAATQRIGRRLEMRLRIKFLEKIPRLGDRYFHSRLTSDMANRAHSLAKLKTLSTLVVNFLRLAFQLLFTSIGVFYLDPANAPFAILFSLVFIAISYVSIPILQENSLRVSTLSGALSRFYLDAMLGLIPLRTHAAERSLRREHEGLLTEWMRANISAARAATYVQGISALMYSLFAITMVLSLGARNAASENVLLLLYWTLNLPVLATTMSQTIQQYPTIRNTILRVLEPLGAPDESDLGIESQSAQTPISSALSNEGKETEDTRGIGIEMRGVMVQAGGHTILSKINLKIAAGEHVAIVGPSGAGKSSLVGILLGWHKPALGQVLIDEEPLNGNRLQALRRETAWVDPAVQLWNRSLLDNLIYGNGSNGEGLSAVIEQADLYDVMARLPDGLQTVLGEGGGLVSGGEGQRVRLGRAMKRSKARLVILDEPFRGLDRAMRRTLLARARAYWNKATLICITHDVGETQSFDRAIVIENGQIVEDASPGSLARRRSSRYHAFLQGEAQVRRGLWESADWRRLWVQDGKLSEMQGKEVQMKEMNR